MEDNEDHSCPSVFVVHESYFLHLLKSVYPCIS